MRLRCHLLGCCDSSAYPGCHFCGAAIYDADYIQSGKLEPLLNAWRRLRRKLTHGPMFGMTKCDQCGRWFWLGYDDILCSEECHDRWLPF